MEIARFKKLDAPLQFHVFVLECLNAAAWTTGIHLEAHHFNQVECQGIHGGSGRNAIE
jgi:hypothetical protein